MLFIKMNKNNPEKLKKHWNKNEMERKRRQKSKEKLNWKKNSTLIEIHSSFFFIKTRNKQINWMKILKRVDWEGLLF